MPGLSGLALTTEQTIEILSLYATSQKPIIARATEPGWEKFGGMPWPTTADIRLDVMGSVSDPSLTMQVRLYCVTDGFAGEVSGSRVQISGADGGTIDKRVLSSQFTLVAGRLYQFQAQAIGNEGDAYFAHVTRAAPTGI